MKVYIYALCDPETDQVRYIGKTVKPLEKRLAIHLCKSQLQSRCHRVSWIKSLLNRGLKPTIRLIAIGDESNWQELECLFIKYYRAIGCNLVNMSAGGDGASGVVRSEETRRRLSEANKGNIPWIKGKKLSQETKHKIRLTKLGELNPNFGKKASEETRKKQSIAQSGSNNGFFGRRHSEEARRKISESRRRRTIEYARVWE